MSDTSNPEGTGIDNAASAFFGLLDGNAAPEEPEEEEAEAAPAEGEDAPEEQSGGESEDASEDAGDHEQTQTKRYTVKVDGKALEVDENELLAGYQRQADYTRKTQALSEERRAFEAERQALAAERQHYAQQLAGLIQQIRAEASQEPDWTTLARERPDEYIVQRAVWDQRQAKLQAATLHHQQILLRQQEEMQKAQREHLKREQERLIEALPDWKDPAKAQAEKAGIVSYLQGAGYTDEEISGLADHRAVIVARKAMMYDALMAKRPEVEKKVAAAPKMHKAGVAPTRGQRGQEQRAAKLQQLRKTGRVEDAAAIFQDLL